VVADLSDGRREVALTLTGDDEFEDLATHGGEDFGHGLPFECEQLFVE
jgi:hypothetical protein